MNIKIYHQPPPNHIKSTSTNKAQKKQRFQNHHKKEKPHKTKKAPRNRRFRGAFHKGLYD
ncbi:MAG: hypothetical protein COB02_16985 [Candidatus Cloacimonadota bacterium]|nr:MAG: hypothetical protein COB02_16985 [Candidatus Cloacimonadota bacterium]